MIKKPRDFLWAVPLALFITSPLWKPSLAAFLAPQSSFEENAKIRKAPDTQHFNMSTVELTLTSNGQKEWLINAERAKTGRSDQEILMDMVYAKYIGNQREPTNITSKKGIYYIEKRQLILIDDVVVEKPESKQVLYTELLHYYDDTKMAVSPGDVEIVGPNFKLKGGRMDYDLATDGYDFSERVKVDL